MTKSKIKAVIFDLGGVVVKWRDEIAFRKAAKIAGVPFSKLRKYSYPEIPRIWKGQITEKEFWRHVLKKCGVEKNNILQKVDDIWSEEYRKKNRLNKEVIKIIMKLRGKYRLGVISNLVLLHDVVNRKRNYYKYLQHEVLSYKVGLIKPDPRIYRLAAKKVGCIPQECVFIDDKSVNVAGARRAGMNAIHFRNAAQLRKDLRKYGVYV